MNTDSLGKGRGVWGVVVQGCWSQLQYQSLKMGEGRLVRRFPDEMAGAQGVSRGERRGWRGTQGPVTKGPLPS